MIEKIMGWLSGGGTMEKQSNRSRNKALTVEETVLLASGMDLKTIQTRKSNPVFVKMSSSTQPNWKISKQQSPKPEQDPQVLDQQLKEPGDINDSAREGAKAVEMRALTEKALEKQDEET